MTDHLRSLSSLAPFFVTLLPERRPARRATGRYEETPESLALKLRRFLDEGWVNIVGGCCGTTSGAHRGARRAGRGPAAAPAARPARVRSAASRCSYPADDNRPMLVGERTNVIGSRKFKELIVAERFEEAAEVGRAQVKAGAQVLDVCLANPDRDELADMDAFIDRADPEGEGAADDRLDRRGRARAGAEHCQGKAIVNSINLEDGEERFEKVVPLLRRYGAAVVVGCIDEDKQRAWR